MAFIFNQCHKRFQKLSQKSYLFFYIFRIAQFTSICLYYKNFP
jgi:hypothetical protein